MMCIAIFYDIFYGNDNELKAKVEKKSFLKSKSRVEKK